MTVARIAALPMYDFPDLRAAHDALWQALTSRLAAAGVERVPQALSRDLPPVDSWRHPGLLLGQACEYPLAKSHGAAVQIVATPRYSAPGCYGARYRSAIVVRREDSAATLADLKGRRCAVNQIDSNSGMNLLRAAIAPLADGAAFFGAVTVSGAHIESARMVAAAQADVAALDCVSFAHLQRFDGALTAGLRVVAWSSASPSLPLITTRATDAATLHRLRNALASIAEDPALEPVRARLFLRGFDFDCDGTFSEVLRLAPNTCARCATARATRECGSSIIIRHWNCYCIATGRLRAPPVTRDCCAVLGRCGPARLCSPPAAAPSAQD